jgi:biotin synthase
MAQSDRLIHPDHLSDVKSTQGGLRAELANATVGLKKEFYGKGPVAAKAYVNDNYIFVVLEEGLTKNEETLLDAGQESLVRNYRLAFQEAMTETTTEAVERLHAMMTPDQILEHAKAAEAAGAHRFCMVTQGQGLSKRDFQNILDGARLVAEQTNLKRCASIGHMSPARATALREAGIQRVHHNVETAESYYPEVSSTVRYEGRLRTIDAVREAGLETCVGGILNLGESREQRVEMAFQLAKVDPTSVPINLLNPRPGTKFGDRDYMDPWEAVKWIAIFRLILPEALFRLCGGRVENLGELQPLAVKAGLNGVMMGNFLTTLGSEPEDDRAMFEELGLNTGRWDDNGANPRPDNRSGWLDGDTPETPIDRLVNTREEAPFWDPATQLRHKKKSAVPPRPDGAPNAFPEVVQVEPEHAA